MRKPPLRYGLFLGLLATIVIIILLSVAWGAGYVLLDWLGWRVQSSAAFLMIWLAVFVTLLAYLLVWIRQIRAKRKLRQKECPGHIENLNWFEQLGCLWLLEARYSKPESIQKIFNQSSLLRPLVEARLAREAGQFTQANQALQRVAPVMQDLAALSQIELLIDEQEGYQAVSQLNQLVQKPKSDFIRSLGVAYQAHIDQLWKKLARMVPWVMVSHGQSDSLLTQRNILQSLSDHVGQSTPTQQQQVIAYFDAHFIVQEMQELSLGEHWLELLAVLPDTEKRRIALLEKLLAKQFDPAWVFQWLQLQRQQNHLTEQSVMQYVDSLSQRYPAQTVLDLAKWYILQANGQADAAAALLARWPQDPHFAYLRVRYALSDQPQLLADLDVLYNLHANKTWQ